MSEAKYYATYQLKADVFLPNAHTIMQAAKDAVVMNGANSRFGIILKVERRETYTDDRLLH